jgi:hypothetical protein
MAFHSEIEGVLRMRVSNRESEVLVSRERGTRIAISGKNEPA